MTKWTCQIRGFIERIGIALHAVWVYALWVDYCLAVWWVSPGTTHPRGTTLCGVELSAPSFPPVTLAYVRSFEGELLSPICDPLNPVHKVSQALFVCLFLFLFDRSTRATRIESWEQDWLALNVVSASMGAGVITMVRTGNTRGPMVVRAMVGGAAVGLVGSLGYVAAMRWRRKRVGEQEQQEHDNGEPWFTLPRWSPLRKMEPEELEERNKWRRD